MRIQNYFLLCVLLSLYGAQACALQTQLTQLTAALNRLTQVLGIVQVGPPIPAKEIITDQPGRLRPPLPLRNGEPAQPTPAPSTDLTPAELKKRAEERREREAARKRKFETGPTTERFVLGVLQRYPSRSTSPEGLSAKDFTVEKITIKSVSLGADKYLNDLAANLFTPEDKKDKQPLAKKTLNGLLFFVKNTVVQPQRIKKIYDLVVYILNINPLLINTAAAVLREIGFNNFVVHRLMVLFFNERIKFIREQLEELKLQATEGVIQDVDEAFAYSIALSSELQRQESVLLQEQSTVQQKKMAQKFVDKVKELRKKLCDIITAPDNIVLFKTKPALQSLYRMICGKQQKADVRVYCVTAPHTYGPLLTGKAHTYCGFNQEVDDLIKLIDEYRQIDQQGVISTSQRVYTVQSIVSSLEDMNLFFQNPDFCPNCLRRAISEEYPAASKTADVQEPFKEKLAQITAFLQEINNREHSFYLEDFVRTGIPKIKATLDRVRKLTDRESQAIYKLIGINRERRARSEEPLSLQQYLKRSF